MGLITTVTTHYELVIPFWAMAVHRKHGACLYDCSIRPCRTLNSLLLQDKREWCVTVCIYFCCFALFFINAHLASATSRRACVPPPNKPPPPSLPHTSIILSIAVARGSHKTSYACNSIFKGKQCFVYIICGTLAINSMLNLAVEKHAVGV